MIETTFDFMNMWYVICWTVNIYPATFWQLNVDQQLECVPNTGETRKTPHLTIDFQRKTSSIKFNADKKSATFIFDIKVCYKWLMQGCKAANRSEKWI